MKTLKTTAAKRFAACLLIITTMLFMMTGCGSDTPGTGGGTDKDKIAGTAVGEWADSYMTAESDGKAHAVKARVTSVERDAAKVKAAIDDYNVSAKGSVISENTNEGVSYAVAYYEVAFPADFPQETFGITDVVPDFTITSATGEDSITFEEEKDGQKYIQTYSGLDQVWEIGDVPQGYDFHAGDTYKGAFVFLMVDGYDDYLIAQKYNDGSKDGILYFAVK